MKSHLNYHKYQLALAYRKDSDIENQKQEFATSRFKLAAEVRSPRVSSNVFSFHNSESVRQRRDIDIDIKDADEERESLVVQKAKVV